MPTIKCRLALVSALAALAWVIPATVVHTQSGTSHPLKTLPFRHIGPPVNRINGVAGVAGDSNVVYAGTPSGGIFKSIDGGLHWQPIVDDQVVASIGALAVSRSDANVVWAGTGDPNIRPNIEIGNGVYKSTDAGKTWSHMGLEETGRIGRIVIDPRNPSTVFVAAMVRCRREPRFRAPLTPDVLSARAHLFDPRPAYLFALRPPSTTESFASEFDPPSNAGRNPPSGRGADYVLSERRGDGVCARDYSQREGRNRPNPLGTASAGSQPRVVGSSRERSSFGRRSE